MDGQFFCNQMFNNEGDVYPSSTFDNDWKLALFQNKVFEGSIMEE